MMSHNAAIERGCYSELGRYRNFAINPGNYDHSALTVDICRQKCGDWWYPLAAVTAGQFCFCAQSLPAIAPSQPDQCNLPCSGNSADTCGGDYYASVHDSILPVRGLRLFTPGDAIEVGHDLKVICDIKVNTSVLWSTY